MPPCSHRKALFHAGGIVAGYATGTGIRNRHGFIRLDSFDEGVVLARYGKKMGGDIVHPVVFPVPRIEPFAETGSGLRCFRLMAAGAADLGFFDGMRCADYGLGVFGNIGLFGMA